MLEHYMYHRSKGLYLFLTSMIYRELSLFNSYIISDVQARERLTYEAQGYHRFSGCPVGRHEVV